MLGVGRVFILVIALAIVADYLKAYIPAPHSDDSSSTTTEAAAAESATTETSTSAGSVSTCQATVVERNTEHVLRLLNRIVRRPYFRYFKVNTHRECPFWAVQLLCTSADSPCSLCTCDASDVPIGVTREPRDMSEVVDAEEKAAPDQSVVEMGMTPSSIDLWGGKSSSSVPPPHDSDNHKHIETAGGGVHEDPDLEYVDLALNPEGNTGYTGPMANRVWEAIYGENCLKDASEKLHVPSTVNVQQCSEFHVFYRLMSGFHSSITVNVATNFHRVSYETSEGDDGKVAGGGASSGEEEGRRIPMYEPNCGFLNRLKTFSDRRENLEFLYHFTLRAVKKASRLFIDDIGQLYATGDEVQDKGLIEDLTALFESDLLCSASFDETRFLESPYGRQLVPQMKVMMRNISSLMDCVSCQKCRLWGKLESQGIATALKIITHEEEDDVTQGGGGGGHHHHSKGQTPLVLRRGEKVSIMNLLRQLTVAVWSLRSLCNEENGGAVY